MKLFSICLGYGIAVAVARDMDEVVDLINNHDEIVHSFINIFGDKESKEEILECITEIPGYEVNGPAGIIDYYKE
jgi:succinyl-CoA synthetase beta subunit